MKEVTRNTPALRFPEFSDHWVSTELGKTNLKVIDGDRGLHYPSGDDLLETGYCLFLNAKNVTSNGFVFTEKTFISKEKDERLRKGKLRRNDIVLTTRGTVGNTAYYDKNVPFEHIRINSGMVLFRNDGPEIDSRFLYIAFSSPSLRKQIATIAFGSAQFALTVSEISKFRISLTSISEQQKIAAFLSAVEERIDQLARKKDLLLKYKRGMMQQIFAQEIRFKDDNGNDFPDWEEKSVAEICEVVKGEQLNGSELSDGAEFPMLNGGVEPSGYTEQWNTEANTITISEGGNSCGFVNLMKVRFWCGGHCYAVKKITESVSIDFLYQSLKYKEAEIMRLRVGSGLPNIQKKDLNRVSIWFPHQGEQIQIARLLSVLDEKVALLKKQLEITRTFRKGLLQQMFV